LFDLGFDFSETDLSQEQDMTSPSITKWRRNRKRVVVDRSLVVGGKRCSSFAEICAQLNVSVPVCGLDDCAKFLVVSNEFDIDGLDDCIEFPVVGNEFDIANRSHPVEFPWSIEFPPSIVDASIQFPSSDTHAIVEFPGRDVEDNHIQESQVVVLISRGK